MPVSYPRRPCRRCGLVVVHSLDGSRSRTHWCPHSHVITGPFGRDVTMPHRCADFALGVFETSVSGGAWRFQVGCRECQAAFVEESPRRAIAFGRLAGGD